MRKRALQIGQPPAREVPGYGDEARYIGENQVDDEYGGGGEAVGHIKVIKMIIVGN
jgi:hypothetical protein